MSTMAEEHCISILYDIYKSNNELITTLLYRHSNNRYNINNINNLITTLNERNAIILNVIVRYLNTHINNNFLNSNFFSNSTNRNNYNNARRRNSTYAYTNTNPIVSPINRYTQQLYIPARTNNRDFFNSFLEPIEVFPTTYQVEIATRQIRYGDIENPLNNSCPISLERFDNDDTVTVIRHCSHIFNTDEINNWFRSNCRCPVCRYDIREFSTTNENTTAETTTDTSNNALQEIVDRLLHTLTYDSSFNTYLDSTEEDASNNDILATFYLTYR